VAGASTDVASSARLKKKDSKVRDIGLWPTPLSYTAAAVCRDPRCQQRRSAIRFGLALLTYTSM
jgi:hypothetical protein